VKAGLPILMVWALAACSPDPRTLALADIDFTDMGAVQEIRHSLPAEDRPVFSTFIVKHVATSSTFCGETLVNKDGKEPRTLGEALVLTVLREEKERRERLAAERPLPASEVARREVETLTSRRELLIGELGELQARNGAAAMQTPEWASLNERIADLNRRIDARRSDMESAAQQD